MLRLAEKAFAPARIPFPVMHVDTGHNFPEVLEFRDRAGRRARRPADRRPACRRRSTAAWSREAAGRHRATGSRRRCCSTRSRSTGSTRCSAAPAATRRRPAPRSGCSPSATSSASGTRKNQRPELWALYNGRIHQGERIRVFPLSNWTELDIWQYIAREEHRAPVDLLRRTSARSSSATACSTPSTSSLPREAGESRSGAGALPHRRRRDLHRRRRAPTPTPSRRSSPRSRPPGSPSAARPAATTGSARPPWKTARGGVLLMTHGASCAFATAGSRGRRQVAR